MNEKGFMYPVTLCILILFSIFLQVHFNHFVIEKRFSLEIEQFEKNQMHFIQSIKKVEVLLNEETYDLAGRIIYEDGTVLYTIEEIGTNLLQITFRLQVESRRDVTGLAFYDTDLRKMIKWVEN